MVFGIYGHYGSNSMQVQKSFELAISDEFEAEEIYHSYFTT